MSWHPNPRLLHRVVLCAVLDDTCALFKQTGFSDPTVAELKTLVAHLNRAGATTLGRRPGALRLLRVRLEEARERAQHTLVLHVQRLRLRVNREERRAQHRQRDFCKHAVQVAFLRPHKPV